METETNVAETQVTETQTALPPTNADVTEASPAETPTTQTPPSPEQQPFTPNYKIKVLGKEHEIEEWARPLVTKDTEAKFRELYEKAYGLEPIKEKGLKAEESYKRVAAEKEELVKGLQELGYLKENDFGAFIQTAKIPPQKVFQWVLEQVKLQQASPEERQEWESAQDARRRAYSSEKQLSEVQHAHLNQVRQFKEMQVDANLSRQEIKSAAESYDERRGKSGAFKDLVYMVGKSHFDQTGQDIPVEQAVKEAMDLVGLSAQQTPVPQQAQVVAPVVKPTLPNVGSGKGTSPIESSPRSIEDIKQLYKTKYGRN
jgi:hypothetical protein